MPKTRERLLSVLLTCFLVGLVIFSSPIQALQMSIQTNKPSYTRLETVTFTVNTRIEQGERLPINNVTLSITGPGGNFSCVLPHDYSYRSQVITCDSQTINAALMLDSNFGYGYGYLNADHDSSYNWGYGYGYGYTSGSVDMNYTIQWIIPSDLAAGGYTAEITYDANGDLLTESTTFRIESPSTGGGSNILSGGGELEGTTTQVSTTTTSTTTPTTTSTTTPTTTTTTTIPEEQTPTNPLTGLVSLGRGFLDLILRFLAWLGIKF